MGRHILLWVEHTVLLEDFAHDRYGGVDRVGDYKDKGAWAVSGNTFSQVADNSSVDLEQNGVEKWISISLFLGELACAWISH